MPTISHDREETLARWERGGRDRVPEFIDKWSPQAFLVSAGISAVFILVLAFVSPWFLLLLVVWGIYLAMGVRDMTQVRHTILRNYPVLGRLRYMLESLRPELRQYFVESDSEENPYSRERRSLIYQRSKNTIDTVPFGTKMNVYEEGYEWLNHSMYPKKPREGCDRVLIGNDNCEQPYRASLFNISAMSYGSLSRNAVLALNHGAKMGRFYHNTGEGGISPYHLEPGGDLCWQIGTGYFGCRTTDGRFEPERFKENAQRPTVKLIELKLSQGAKPAHGGILPGKKVTEEIARIRGVPVGQDVLSPPHHTAFDTPQGLLRFIAQLRELSGGKPVGFKLCVGNPVEFLAICRAMLEEEITPDFISVDGAEGGTGAAPLEFSNSVGMPLDDGLSFVHNALIGVGLRDRIKLVSAGKIASGFHVVRQLALGADLCNSARGMMFALGCIQALKCNTNKCPAGVATQDDRLMRGLDVDNKASRVYHFQEKTVEATLDLVGAAGLETPEALRPFHVWRRISPTETCNLGDIYPTMPPRGLLEDQAPERMAALWKLI